MARRTNQITKQWAAREIELLESPAYRALSLSAHRALSRIEVELAHHGGKDNGKLPCTFDDFEEYGVRRKSIGAALEELEALGFITITELGRPSAGAEYRRPNKFRLTTRESLDGVGAGGCGWRRFKSADEVKRALDEAAGHAENLKCPKGETPPKSGAKRHYKRQNPRGETPLLRAGETPLLSISREGQPVSHRAGPTPDGPMAANDPPAFPLIDGCDRITGRPEPVVVHAPAALTHPIEKLKTVAAPAEAAA
jgi:hypothetical protein